MNRPTARIESAQLITYETRQGRQGPWGLAQVMADRDFYEIAVFQQHNGFLALQPGSILDLQVELRGKKVDSGRCFTNLSLLSWGHAGAAQPQAAQQPQQQPYAQPQSQQSPPPQEPWQQPPTEDTPF